MIKVLFLCHGNFFVEHYSNARITEVKFFTEDRYSILMRRKCS